MKKEPLALQGVPMTKNGTGESMQIELFWDGVREYPAHLLPLYRKLRL